MSFSKFPELHNIMMAMSELENEKFDEFMQG